MTAPLQTTELRSSSGSPIIRQYIQSARSLSLQIVAIESITPALTREQLRMIFRGKETQPAELITSGSAMEQWLTIVNAQLPEKLEDKLALPLILLSPTTWPNFHDLMEEIEEKFEGPIFLVDNSCTAANWAEAVLRVDAYGKVLKIISLVDFA